MTALEKLKEDNQLLKKKIKELEKKIAMDNSEIWKAIESIRIVVPNQPKKIERYMG